MFSFYKMQATGKDFIIVNFLEKRLEYSFKLLSKFLCDRHFGVGGEGVLILENSKIVDFKVRTFNKFGEEVQICGNDLCCMAKYIYENKLIDKEVFQIETKVGIRNVKIEIDNDMIGEIEVDIGEAKFDLEDIPITCFENDCQGILHIENMDVYPVLIGSLYAICFVNDISQINIKKMGKIIENYKYFTDKPNVVFTQIINNENIKIRLWEIEEGEVLSSGTGACAAAVTSNKYKSMSNKIIVDSLGGKQKIYCEKNIKLKAVAENIFYGDIVS